MRAKDLKHFGPVASPPERFTPGPWQIDPDASGLDGWPIRAKQGPIDVCPAKANGLADAQLIAAAPELYAALRRIVTPAMAKSMAETHKPACVCNYCAAIAALSKAGGRS